MPENIDPRFLKTEGEEIFTGNELVLKGCLEAGVQLLTGYPGSPVSEIFEAAQRIAPYLKERGMLAELANNEALAAARLNGSQQMDLRAVAVMKSVGMNVAADGLFAGTLTKTGRKGGAVVVVGDDPWSDTTQVPQDSRRLSDHIMMPVLEPSTFQELKDYIGLGLDLSKHSDLYVTVLLTTNLADGGAKVKVGPHQALGISTKNKGHVNTDEVDHSHSIALPPFTGQLEQEAYEKKFWALLRRARELGINRIEPGARGQRRGFVASGVAYTYLKQALLDLGLENEFPILNLGMTFPVDFLTVHKYLHMVDEVIVVEPKRSFIESQVRDLSARLFQRGRLDKLPSIWGKDFPKGLNAIPARHGLNASVLIKRLVPLFRRWGMGSELMDKELALIENVERRSVTIPDRTATFCAGCPHRDSTSVLLDMVKDMKDPQYMQKKHQSKPVDIVFHGDAGCYSMLFLPPNGQLMHDYSGMGLGGGTGAGLSPFIDNKSVTFIGDGTFFHSGMVAASDALKNNQDITFIILDNKTTAMTGHQPHPGVDQNLMGETTFAQDVVNTLEGLVRGTDAIVEQVDPEKWEDYRNILERTILAEGVKFIVADKECGITFHRRRRIKQNEEKARRGFLLQELRIQVDPDACEYCLECTVRTGCPGLTVTDTAHGPKIATDQTHCVNDGACTRVKACPAFEEVTINRRQAPPPKKISMGAELKAPPRVEFKDVWRGYLAGIGGMGVGSLTSVLARAGLSEGYDVTFCDKKGLAIRNGGVYAHVTFSKDGKTRSPIIPYTKADLLIGIDILEAVRGLDPAFNLRVAAPDRTACVVNTGRHPTIPQLMGNEPIDVEPLIDALRKHTNVEEYFDADVSTITARVLGSSLYDNIAMMGIALQRGLLPLSLKSIETALKETFGSRSLEKNLQALHLGRDIVVHSERYRQAPAASLSQTLAEKEGRLRRRYGRKSATHFRRVMDKALGDLRLDVSELKQLVLCAYELVHVDGVRCAENYLAAVQAVAARDSAKKGWRATSAALRGLHKVTAIKDEVYVAHLLTSEEKYERDVERHGIDPTRGDRIHYKHFNRPRFDILGIPIEFELTTRDWMLKLMRGMRFLRGMMPAWHAEERDFRDWYVRLTAQFNPGNDEDYNVWVEILQLTERVRGYREVRWPTQNEVKAEASRLLAKTDRGGGAGIPLPTR